MRLIQTIFMVALVGIWSLAPLAGDGLGQPIGPAKPKKTDLALPEAPPRELLGPGDVVVRKQGKMFKGWVNLRGKIGISNDYGRTIYSGQVDKMGSAELRDDNTGATYTGRINPMGRGRLFDLNTGDSVQIEILR